MKSGAHTVLILVDALRWDYVSPVDTPFLQSLAESPNAFRGRTRETFGFQTRPAFFAGLYPETSQICTMFVHSPDTSPFRLLQYYPGQFIKMLPKGKERIESFVRRAIESRVRRRSQHSAVRYYATSASIPLELLPAFDFGEQELPWIDDYEGAVSLFTVLKEHNFEWFYIGWPLITDCQSDGKMVQQCLHDVTAQHRFCYVHLSQLDALGHAHGPHSPQLKQGLNNIDDLIRELVTGLESKLSVRDLNLVIFGDHGMVMVRETVDLLAALQDSEARLGTHYVVFLDSTMARFWFFKEGMKSKVESILGQFKGKGHILGEEEMARYRVRFKNHRHWDLLWLANEGVLIHPNFFHTGGNPPKGMHGYAPDLLDNQGYFLLHAPCVERKRGIGVVDLVDIFPTVLDLAELPIPESNQGRSVLRWEKASEGLEQAGGSGLHQ